MKTNKEIIEDFEKEFSVNVCICKAGFKEFLIKALVSQKAGIKEIMNKEQHNEYGFCRKKGKQFKKCCRCVLDDILKSL